MGATGTLPVEIAETEDDMLHRLEGEYEQRRILRRLKGVKHGADCDCGDCLEALDGVNIELDLLPLEGITVDVEDNGDMIPVVPPEYRHRFHPDARYLNGGPVIHSWNLPHHGDGAPDCGEILERVGGKHPTTGNLSWWGRLKRCGQRDCQRCGPVIEAGKILEPGTWETRSARRAAEAIMGHMEDRRLGLLKIRVDRKKRVVTDPATKMMRRGHHKPPRIAHVVYSVPGWMWDDLPAQDKTKNRLSNVYRTAYGHLKAVGVTGGYAVTHGVRVPSRWNERKHVDEGLHLHGLAMTKEYLTARVDGDEVRRIFFRTSKPCRHDIQQQRACDECAKQQYPCKPHRALQKDCDDCLPGVVIERISDHHKGSDVEALNDTTTEGPEPNRSLFGSLLYLLSHATWPTLAVMREPGEDFEIARHRVVFPRYYPAFVKTSTQTKAIRPFGEWVHAPEAVVVLPVDEDTCPITGHAFAEDEVWPVIFDKPPPDDEPGGIVLRGHFSVDAVNRVFLVGATTYRPKTGEQARIAARLAGRPVPKTEGVPMQPDSEAEARRQGRALAEQMRQRDAEAREWEL